MAVTLTRTAFSPIVRDAHDYGCAVFDADANMVAMANDATPGLSVSSMISVRNMLKVYPPETLQPGDVLIMNDPWLATGHLLDLTIVTPVFFRTRLAAFTAAVAHHMDIGGRKTTPDSTEVYEEGLFLPVLKLFERGQPNETLFRILESNVRVPAMVIGDVHSQVAANAQGAQRICELLGECRWSDLNTLGQAVLDKAEAAMRAAIAAIPDGAYHGEMVMDGFDHDLKMVAAMTVSGDELRVDFTGTSDQIDRGINSVLSFTQGLTLVAIKMIIDPSTPINGGCIRPLTIHAPEGSLLGAKYPAPVLGRSIVGQYIQPTLLLALDEAIPGRVCAPSGGPVWSERFYGNRSDGTPFFVLQLLNGGQGARSDRDGVSALSFPGNVACIPVELFEENAPLLVERKGLIVDSGGAGQYRGGLAQEFRVRVLEEVAGDPTLSIRADRTRNPAPGIFDARSGKRARIIHNGAESLHPKRPTTIQARDVISWQLAGGGGLGDPYTREPSRVLLDVNEGFISPTAAEQEYGVRVRRAGHRYEINRVSTEALRGQSPAERPAQSRGQR